MNKTCIFVRALPNQRLRTKKHTKNKDVWEAGVDAHFRWTCEVGFGGGGGGEGVQSPVTETEKRPRRSIAICVQGGTALFMLVNYGS